MERKINLPPLLIYPSACCWTAIRLDPNGEPQTEESPTFAKAVHSGLQEDKEYDSSVVVALPVRYGIFERFCFPATHLDELESMARLQFEKLLPYPIEETTISLQILAQTDSETILTACAARVDALETLCAPLLEHGFPQRLTFHAIHIAAQAPASSIACGIWREEEDYVFAIFENSSLGYVEYFERDVVLLDELPRTLLRAEAVGAPIRFSEILLDSSLKELEQTLNTLLQAPARIISSYFPVDDSFDITPSQWRDRQALRKRRQKLRQQLTFAAILYAAMLLISLVCLALKSHQLESLQKQTLALQPRVDTLIEQQSRWKAIAPAINPQQYLVELLFQTFQALPSKDTQITRFELARDQMVVEGEAPDAQSAVAFTEKLKSRPELADFRFEASPPVLQPNEHAQFRIFGKR